MHHLIRLLICELQAFALPHNVLCKDLVLESLRVLVPEVDVVGSEKLVVDALVAA